MSAAPCSGLPAERPAGWLNRSAFWLFWATFGVPLRVLFRLRAENRPKLRGAYVVVANHTSFLDPIFIGALLTRRVTFLMTVLHFRSAGLGWFFRWNRAIPLALRGAHNRDALRSARAVLQRGDVLGIFPEGGLSRDGLPLLGNPGAVSLGLAEDVPIVPVFLTGAGRAMPAGSLVPRFGRRVTVRFGEPIHQDELFGGENHGDRRTRLMRATRVIMDRIAALGGTESREAFLERRLGATTG